MEVDIYKPDRPAHIKIKGAAWSLMSPYGAKYFRTITEHILVNKMTKT